MASRDHGTSESAHAECGRSQPADPGQELEEIGEDECFALLERQNLGRLAVVREGRPEIFPVNYAMDGRTITIRTGGGVKLTYASLAHVAFEVEDIDPLTREGWVVEVRGFAEEITDAGDRWSEHARHAGVTPWVKGQHDHYLAISHAQVSGRRIGPPITP
jgi:hypothetical protein